MKLAPVQKISVAGLLLALVIIFTRFLAIQNIPLIPFVRVSLGPALIIFSSIFLGPVYGGIIGGASDILGIILVPNALGYSINPFFTIIYTLLGVLPWCFIKLFKLVKNEKINFYIFLGTMVMILVFVTLFLMMNDYIVLFGTVYNFELWQKWLIVGLAILLSIAMVVAIYFINKSFAKKSIENAGLPTPYQVSLVCLVCELLVMLIGNSIVKSFFFEIDFVFVLFAQAVVFFIDVPLNSIVTTYLLLLMSKIFKPRGGLMNA